jgi:hypothetical protein
VTTSKPARDGELPADGDQSARLASERAPVAVDENTAVDVPQYTGNGFADSHGDPVARAAAVWQRFQGRMLAIALALATLLLIGIRLGPSLLGLKVFLGLDLLYQFAPFSSLPGSHPLRTSFYVSDQLDSTIPALHEIAQRVLHGDIAAWSSMVGGGAPLMGTPDFAVLTPGRWVFLLLPAWLAPGWAQLFQMAFAAIFMFLLVRRLNGSKVAAGLAGFIYPLSGFMIGWANWPQVTVGCAIPMLFWSVERLIQERRIRCALPVAIASALLMFGGFPAVAGQAFYFAAGYAVVRLVSTYRKRIREILGQGALLAVGVGLGVGVTAIQLLPFAHNTLENVDLSYRDGGFFVHDGFRYLLTTVFPGTFAGNHTAGTSTGQQLLAVGSPMDLNTYVGSVVLLLAVLGLFPVLTGRLRGSAGVYFAGMIVLIIGLLWFQGPWSNWMDHLPVFHGNPINRIRSQLGVPVAVLAAAGFDLLRGTRPAAGWTRRAVSGWGWSVVGSTVLVTASVVAAGIWIYHDGYIGLATYRAGDIALAAIPLVIIAVLVVVGVRFRIARTLALIVVLFAVSIQAVAATAFYWPTANRAEFYPTTGGIRYLQQHLGDDRMATLGYAIRPNITEYYGLRSLNGHSFFPKPMESVINGIDPFAFTGPTYSVLSPHVAWVINSPALGRMGVRYMVGATSAVNPAQPSSALAILGRPDPVAAPAGLLTLPAGQAVSTTIKGGSLRGVNLLLNSPGASTVTVSVRNAAGQLVTTNMRAMLAGTAVIPVPLAADAPGAPIDQSGPLTVEVTSSLPGVKASTDSASRIRVQPVRPTPGDSQVRMVYAGDNLVIYERLDYVPRIHWAGKATVVRGDAARLASVTKSPLEAGDVILAAPSPSPVDHATAPRAFAVQEDSGDTIQVRVDTRSAGYVVVTDNLVGNFDATVDGHSSALVSADYSGAAVYVPAGTHEVALHYNPTSQSTAFKISAVSVLGIALLGISPLWLKRRRGSASVEAG